MNEELRTKLLYRRKFVLAPKQLNDFPAWKKTILPDNYYLYTHTDLKVTETNIKNEKLILLGDIFDPENPKHDNIDLLAQILTHDKLTDKIESTYKYAGRFIIICIKNNEIFLFHDASASRKIYHTTNLEKNWCASLPQIIAKYCNIEKTNNQEVLDFYNSRVFFAHRKIDVLNNTIFDNIKQLLPNHYLDLKKGRPIRYWPVNANDLISLEEGLERGSKMIRGIVESYAGRYKLMLAVTSGNDTRLMLAASKNIVDDVYIYINKNPDIDENHRDLRVGSKIIKKLGLKYNILEYSNDVDEDFREIFLENNIFASEELIGLIYNIYYLKFPDRVNMPGNFSDISRNFFSTHKKNITPELLSKLWSYGDNKYVIGQYYTWFNEMYPLAKKLNYNILDLFNWEERNGNWYTKTQVDKDIAQEELIPFNSRLLMSIFLAVPKKYRDLDTNIFYRSLVKKLWPEAMAIPMYPKSYLKFYLKKAGLFWLLKRILRPY